MLVHVVYLYDINDGDTARLPSALVNVSSKACPTERIKTCEDHHLTDQLPLSAN